MFRILNEHLARPRPFSVYTAETLWTDDHISGQMLEHHLDPEGDMASRNHAFIRRAAAWLGEEFDLPGRDVLDLGCGPGLYAVELAELGARVLGVDFSRKSIEYARRQAEQRDLALTYEVADFRTYETRRKFDLICLIYGEYCALDPAQRVGLLRRAANWVKPTGSIVLDVFGKAHLDSIVEGSFIQAWPDGAFWSGQPHVVVRTTFLYDQADLYLDRFLVVEPGGHWEVFNWLQCFDAEGLAEEMERAGWSIQRYLGSVAGDPYDAAAPQFAIVARPSGSGRLGP